MTIQDVITRRQIREVLHFTPHSGLLGILHSGTVLSRERLPDTVSLEHIYQPNAEVRRDLAWLDYVNLSISGINHQFFDVSCRWHRASDLWWCILSFDSQILTHPGVFFATTNNMYSGVVRAAGPEGLQRLFEPRVELWYGNETTRHIDTPDHLTTCPQAEALYPMSVSTRYLRKIYVESDDDADEVHAQLMLTGNTNVEVVVDKLMFKSNRKGWS